MQAFVYVTLLLLAIFSCCLADKTRANNLFSFGEKNHAALPQPHQQHTRQGRQLDMVLCLAPGFIPYPGDTTKYLQCILIGARWYYYVYQCPSGSFFVPSRSLCVLGGGDVTTPTIPTTAAVSSTPSSMGTSAASDSTTPAASDSTTPASSDSTTPASSDSTTPASSDSTTPASSDSTTPASSDSTTPASSDSTTPESSDSTTPAGSDSTTPTGSATTASGTTSSAMSTTGVSTSS